MGTVSAEIPVGPTWCEIRQTVFGWTTQKFPFGVKTAHTLKIREPHVSTVTGRAFYEHWPRASGSFKPAKDTERLRGLGNSSRDGVAGRSVNCLASLPSLLIRKRA